MADAPTINTPLHVLESLNDALLDKEQRLAKSVAVVVLPERRNDRDWPQLAIAAIVTQRGVADSEAVGPVAVWVTSGSGGPVAPANGAAREHSVFGSAARGGSRMDDMHRHVAGLPEVAQAVRLVSS